MVRKRGVARRSFAHRRVRRVKKYDHNVIPKRFKIQLPSMSTRLEPPLYVHVECETPTMELLETLGVPTEEWQYYLGFMKRMIELYRQFTAETLVKERDALIAEYVLRGKSEDVLEAVEEVAALCAEAEFEMDLWTRDFYKMIQFQHPDGFEWWTVDSGYYSISEGLVQLGTGVNINSEAEMLDEISHPLVDLGTLFTWDKERRMRVAVFFFDNSDQEIYIVSGGRLPAAEGFIGFKIVDDEIFGVVCNGVSETLTAALRSFNANDEFILEARFKPNQECRFYIDGVEVGVLTSGLPSGLNQANWLAHAFIKNTAAADKYIEFDLWEFYQRR